MILDHPVLRFERYVDPISAGSQHKTLNIYSVLIAIAVMFRMLRYIE